MDKINADVQNFESEYSLEIRSAVPNIEGFYDLGVTKSDLVAEILLRNIYGDETFSLSQDTDEAGEKNVVKVEERDIELSKQQMTEANKIDDDPFNAELDSLLVKLG